MKVRDSGMPDQDMWATFFDPIGIFDHLGLADPAGTITDFGSGYGTFTLPAARRFVQSKIIGIDIEAELNQQVVAKAHADGLANLSVETRDFVLNGTGLDANSSDIVFLFNILHAENPMVLLGEAFRILKRHGTAAMIHWNHDPSTPRGPRMEIRPTPDQMLMWAAQAGFTVPDSVKSVAPFHYGFLATKPGA